jgi:hypothetical protein
MDWMKYGVAPRLEADHLEELRDVKIPVRQPVAANPINPVTYPAVFKSAPVPTTIKLEGIMWGSHPVAIINGRSFFVQDQSQIKLAGSNVTIRCLAIQPDSVRIRNVVSGHEQNLSLPLN